MNSKVCKTLRSAARSFAAVNKLPERQLLQYNANAPVNRGVIINDPNTVRGFYRMLKKAQNGTNPTRTQAATS